MKITPTKRRAIVVLFLHGWNPPEIGRLFRLKTLVIEQVIREHSREPRA